MHRCTAQCSAGQCSAGQRRAHLSTLKPSRLSYDLRGDNTGTHTLKVRLGPGKGDMRVVGRFTRFFCPACLMYFSQLE